MHELRLRGIGPCTVGRHSGTIDFFLDFSKPGGGIAKGDTTLESDAKHGQFTAEISFIETAIRYLAFQKNLSEENYPDRVKPRSNPLLRVSVIPRDDFIIHVSLSLSLLNLSRETLFPRKLDENRR